jgi:hypothetical protein
MRKDKQSAPDAATQRPEWAKRCRNSMSELPSRCSVAARCARNRYNACGVVGVLVPAAADDPEARLPPVQEVASAETMKRALCDVSETALLSHFLTLPELP